VSRIPRNLDGPPLALQTGARARPMFAITQAVLATSERLLRSPRLKGRESIVYWVGVKRDEVWVATTVVKPNAMTTRGSFSTSPYDNGEVIGFLADAGLALLAQLHTHPGRFVGHSPGDDEDAFMATENSLSLVVPNYGRNGMRPLTRCGVHRYEAGRFRRLEANEIEADICIVPLSRNLATAKRS
jgi:hypothetical protein